MRDLLKNKKTLIPILLGIAIVVIAIITFIIIGVTGKKSKSRVSVVKLDNTQAATNELGNTYGNNTNSTNNTNNNTTNEVDDDEDKDFGVEEFYQEAAKKFIKGYQDEDEIKEFVEDYFDPKAYVAYEYADLDDSKFLEEYSNLDDNDEKIEEITEQILSLPSAWKQLSEYMTAFGEMSDGNLENMTDENGNTIDLSNMELSLTLVDIDDPEISEDDENISKITLTVDFMGQEQELIMVFYDEVVIYIMNEDGESAIQDFGVSE